MKNMRGIILAGGNGTRLYPSTLAVSKQLLPVYNKPMIYYPLSTLMLAGINEILLVTKPNDTASFFELLGDGSDFGISLNYAVQAEPNGIPEAISIGRHFLGDNDVFLVLGDNIIFGTGLTNILMTAKRNLTGSSIFTYGVRDPQRYGIAIENDRNQIIELIEKPQNPLSNLAITGHYMLTNDSVSRVNDLQKSERGETEIIDLLNQYLQEGSIFQNKFGRGYAWFDCGTHNSLLEASSFVETIERRQGYMVACLEEISYLNKWMSAEEIERMAVSKYQKTDYGNYLLNLLKVDT